MEWVSSLGTGKVTDLARAPLELPDVPAVLPPGEDERADEIRARAQEIADRINRDSEAARAAAVELARDLGLEEAAIQVQGNEHTVQVTVSRVAG